MSLIISKSISLSKIFNSPETISYIPVKYLFTGGIKLNQLSGPVGIYTVVGESSKAGLSNNYI